MIVDAMGRALQKRLSIVLSQSVKTRRYFKNFSKVNCEI